MKSEETERFYIDANGELKPDRRKGADRRNSEDGPRYHEQRKYYRRKIDREIYERDHKQMIEDALNDFAEEHDGHL